MKKKNSKTRIIVVSLIILFAIIIISCILLLIYMFSGNYINLFHVDESSKLATISEATDANVVIVNGIILGANKGNKWISSDKFYEANKFKTEIEVDLFSQNSQYGTFKTASIKKYDNSVIYTTLAKEGIPSSYIALTSTDVVRTIPGMTELEPTKEDEDYVKQAIGTFKLINGSVKVLNVYATNINQVSDKIISAVCEKPNIFGAYSALVYVTDSKPYLVKYAYVRNTKNSDRWPIYSLQFVLDINQDLKPEIVLQETTGNDTSYSILELRDKNVFYEVLRTTIEI